MWRLALSWVKFTDRKSKTQGQLQTRNPAAGKRLSLLGQILSYAITYMDSLFHQLQIVPAIQPHCKRLQNLELIHFQPGIYCIVSLSDNFPTKGFLAHYSSPGLVLGLAKWRHRAFVWIKTSVNQEYELQYSPVKIRQQTLRKTCAVASWLVCSTWFSLSCPVSSPCWEYSVALCSWASHSTLTVPLSTQVYKWVLAKFNAYTRNKMF